MRLAYVVQNTRQGNCTHHAADDNGRPICGSRGHVQAIEDDSDGFHHMDCRSCARILQARLKKQMNKELKGRLNKWDSYDAPHIG